MDAGALRLRLLRRGARLDFAAQKKLGTRSRTAFAAVARRPLRPLAERVAAFLQTSSSATRRARRDAAMFL